MCFGLFTHNEVLVLCGAALMAIVVAMSQPVVGEGGTSNASSSLEYYVQVVLGPPYTGQLAPPFNANTTYNFGAAFIFDFNITEGVSSSSKSLGHASGYVVETSYTATSHQLSVGLVSYDDGAGVNGTLSFQGLLGSSTDEISIVGGSGSFRGARGYIVTSMISPNVYHNTLYFL